MAVFGGFPLWGHEVEEVEAFGDFSVWVGLVFS